MPKITFDNFKGLLPKADIYPGVPKFEEARVGLFSDSIIDPYRMPGILSPFPIGQSFTNESSVTTDITKLINYIEDTADVYGIGGTKIYKIDTVFKKIINTSPFPKTLTAEGTHSSGGHTAFNTSDIIVYENNGTHEIFISYNDDTDGDVARLSSVGSSNIFDLDYYSAVVGGTVLNKNYPHPMAVGDNNICYIANGSILASMNLTTGTPVATDSEIDLLGGWIIKDHISHDGYHLIAAKESHITSTGAISEDLIDNRQKGRCAVFVWDYVKQNFDDIFYIKDSDIHKIFIHDATPYVITETGHISGKLRKLTGGKFKIVKNGYFQYQNEPSLGGVTIKDDIIYWTSMSRGKIYSYNTTNQTLNAIGGVGSSANAMIVSSYYGNIFYIAGSGVIYYYDYLPGGGFDTSVATFKTGLVNFPKHAEIKGFRVYFPDLDDYLSGTGDALEVFRLQAYFNGANGATEVGTIGSDEVSRGYAYIPYNKNDVYSISVGYYYSGSNVALNDPTICPYKIEVDYDITRKR